ncbi:MAG TPA: hypothetical protein VGG53_21385 [Mycobacterium sp.]|jgi:hypothetical protein|uniref:hypothetical protein n=1 Tax=Mycobacterium sp. TaxID=1785 RepID=UPI002F40BE85
MLTESLAVRTLDEIEERLVSPAPILVTEHEVALSTAVALRARPATRRRWFEATHVLLAALNRTRVSSTQREPRTRREYPKRYAFLEAACMAREMERL